MIYVKKNIEIEFKSAIDEKTYHSLLTKFDLNCSLFDQTNFYFDTPNLDLLAQYITLRIRAKGDSVKLTLKKRATEGCLEQHCLLSKEVSDKLLEEGFNTSEYFQPLDYNVTYLTKLDNCRVIMLYEGGKIFFDKSSYNGITDYEIEYEHSNYEIGLKNFKRFLEENNLVLKEVNKKSYRALTTR